MFFAHALEAATKKNIREAKDRHSITMRVRRHNHSVRIKNKNSYMGKK